MLYNNSHVVCFNTKCLIVVLYMLNNGFNMIYYYNTYIK